MTLDDRLRDAREQYRGLTRPEPVPPRGRSRRAAAVFGGVAVVAAVVVGMLWWSSDSPPASRPVDVVSTPSSTALRDPSGVVGEISLDPPGPYRDGQRVIASVPEGFIADPDNPTPPRLCAEVEGIESCDPLDLSLHPGLVGGAERAVWLNQRTFTWDGYRDCADPYVSCRLLWEGNGGVRATALEFVGAPSDDRPALEVRPAGRPGQFVVTPSGLEEYPVMWPPGGFQVTLCAFAPAAAPLDPQGEAIWAFAPPPSVPAVDPPNCDTGVLGSGPILLDSSDGPTTIELPSQFLGYWGWSDCRTDSCFLQLTGANATPLAAAPVVFTENEPRTPRPEITIVDDPPYAVGQEITVEITDLSDEVDTMIGVCSRFQPWNCGYSFETAGSGAYTTTYEIPDIVDGCAPDDCYLELDSSGEGVPPLATVALPIDTG